MMDSITRSKIGIRNRFSANIFTKTCIDDDIINKIVSLTLEPMLLSKNRSGDQIGQTQKETFIRVSCVIFIEQTTTEMTTKKMNIQKTTPELDKEDDVMKTTISSELNLSRTSKTSNVNFWHTNRLQIF
ncbi:hypothetical protein RF11_09749 [Thelohanellus kitauei]|uniref:Uncharacterized protein n=1 Tax=Thelohanellus kitauei TaxID=669202 RepID=A0A0C2MRP1_THEKT|nr:hypothetical protein RF11_09749 [Thelohanellus kitauei]